MRYAARQYAKALYEILKEHKSDKRGLFSANFIKLLKSKKDFKKMRFIESELLEIERREKNIIDVEVLSPYVLSVKSENEIKKIISSFVNNSKKEIHIKNEIDENLIGGFKARSGDYLIDASVRNLLLKLKKNIALAVE